MQRRVLQSKKHDKYLFSTKLIRWRLTWAFGPHISPNHLGEMPTERQTILLQQPLHFEISALVNIALEIRSHNGIGSYLLKRIEHVEQDVIESVIKAHKLR